MNRRFSVLALGAILGALLAMGGCAFDTDPAACEDDLDCDAAWESDDQALGGPDYAHDLDEEIVPQRGDLRAVPPLAEESAAFTAPQLSCPSTTISGTSSTETAYSIEPSTAESTTIERHDLEDHVEALRAGEAPRSATRLVADPADVVYEAIRSGRSLPDMKKRLERICIERALEESGGNITHAAELLGMKRPRVSQLVNQFARDGEEVAS